jgi:DNA-binding transcriptional regulator LsrR (DeoR family)
MSIEDRANFGEHLTEEQIAALAEEFGGQRVYIPRRIRQSHRITRVIGFEAAARLGEIIGGSTWRIPVARDMRICLYNSQGLKRREIARRLCMSEVGLGRAMKRLGLL